MILTCDFCKKEFYSNRKKKFCSDKCCDKKHSLSRLIKKFEIDHIDGEIWKDIRDFSNSYQISSLGRVKSKNRITSDGRRLNEQIIKGSVSLKDGYRRVMLFYKGKYKAYSVHRLVAIHFIENNFNKECVNHIDGVRLNNTIDNLEWCSYKENNKHAYDFLNKKGAWEGIKGNKHPKSKNYKKANYLYNERKI